MKNIEKKNLILDLILILITGGIWNIWMQYRQIRDFNLSVNEDRFSFFKWALLTLLTFGLYHIYHEYNLTRQMYEENSGSKNGFEVGVIAGIISATGLWVFVDLYQQSLLNGYNLNTIKELVQDS